MAIPSKDYILVVRAIVSFSFVFILHTLHCTTTMIIPTPDAYTAKIALFVVVVNFFYQALPKVYSLQNERGATFSFESQKILKSKFICWRGKGDV